VQRRGSDTETSPERAGRRARPERRKHTATKSRRCFFLLFVAPSLSCAFSLPLASTNPSKKTATHRPHESLFGLESDEAVVLALASAVKWETSAAEAGVIERGRIGESRREFDVVRRETGLGPLCLSLSHARSLPPYPLLSLSLSNAAGRPAPSFPNHDDSLRVSRAVHVDDGAKAREVLVEQVFRDGRRVHPQAVSRPSRGRGQLQLLLRGSGAAPECRRRARCCCRRRGGVDGASDAGGASSSSSARQRRRRHRQRRRCRRIHFDLEIKPDYRGARGRFAAESGFLAPGGHSALEVGRFGDLRRCRAGRGWDWGKERRAGEGE